MLVMYFVKFLVKLKLLIAKKSLYIMEIKCADCGCYPSECKESQSVENCPNCSWEKCCCWMTIHN